MDRISVLIQTEKSRSATFWAMNAVLVLFFSFNQSALWHHYNSGNLSRCVACPYATTGMEVLWMLFPILGTAFTWQTMSAESRKLFERYLEIPLQTLVGLTMIKIVLRFSNPDGLSYWSIGLFLEWNWLYITIANLSIWIYQNWNKDFAKTKHGWLTPRQHCLFFYMLPAFMMLASVIAYRSFEAYGVSKPTLMFATSICEATFVLSPIKASLSWHFRP